MPVNKECKYIINTDYVLREIVGELLLIPTGRLSMTSPGTITISETAAFLWNNMKEAKTITQLCEILLKEYDVDKETAFTDVSEMVDSMCDLAIIKKI